MADVDKLMGMAGDTPVYGAYRIDYDSTDDIRSDEDGNERFTGESKSPRPGHRDHPVKDGFQRKIVVEDASTRDEVQAHLDAENINYVTEDVSPTQQERDDIQAYGASNGVEGREAVKWSRALDAANGVADLKEIQRGVNPDTGEEFEPPGAKKQRQR